MSVTKYGVNLLVSKPQTATGYDVSVGPDGAASATVTYTTTASDFKLSNLPAIGSSHPDFKQLKLWDTKATREAGNIMRITSTYKGVGVSNPEGLAQYEFNITSNSEPLLTHPKFAGLPDITHGYQYPLPMINQGEVQAINSKFASPTPATYTKNSVFSVASNWNGEESPLGATGSTHNSTQIGRIYYLLRSLGIESYLTPAGSLKKTFVAKVITNEMYLGLGFILNANNIPRVGQLYEVCKANYRSLLYSGISWKIQGACITVTQDYQMSGVGGWNYILYISPNGADPTKLTAGDAAQVGESLEE